MNDEPLEIKNWLYRKVVSFYFPRRKRNSTPFKEATPQLSSSEVVWEGDVALVTACMQDMINLFLT